MNKNPIIGIIGGTGKMGRWFKAFFEKEGYDVKVASRTTVLTVQELARACDIVIVSVPIWATVEVMRTVAPLVQKHALLTDVTSIKVMPLAAMREAPSATLGMHPLFSPNIATSSGLKIVFCKQKDNEWVSFLQHIFAKNGIEVVVMSAEEHDYHMAYIQALTHAINLLYAKVVFEQKDAISQKLGTPISTLQSLIMGRIITQDLQLLCDIELYNPYFSPLLENLAGSARQLLTVIQKGDSDGFKKLFQSEIKRGKPFAQFATQQTNKLLRLVFDVPTPFPESINIGNLPKKATVAFLGPEGTYTHRATTIIFAKSSYKKVAYETLYDVFRAVLSDEADFAVVPAENSTEGTVRGTLDYLGDSQTFVIGSLKLPIHHSLLSHERKLEDINTVISHPHALAQCRQWLVTNLPHAKQVASASTASSLVKQKGYAYIASSAASRIYKIPVVAKNIEDSPSNATRFYIIAKKRMRVSGLCTEKTLLLLSVYNRVGILRDILNVFANYGLNLTKLESRPSLEKTWDYHFYIEVERKEQDRVLKKALNDLAIFCPVIRILGRT